MIDVLIVGGGPAGQSAALVLARCRRKVVVIDAGQRRNRFSKAMFNYLTRDGIAPSRFATIGQSELHRYGVRVMHTSANSARRLRSGFEIRLQGGRRLQSRKLLLATGMADQVPEIPGFRELYGVSVHHCPYCDAFPWRDRTLAAYGKGRHSVSLALSLLTWSDNVVALSDGRVNLTALQQERLSRLGIVLYQDRVQNIEGVRGRLKRIRFTDGSSIRCDALFFSSGQHQRSSLPEMLGCRIDRQRGVRVDRRGRTGIPGLFVAGDALCEVQFVINAASDGAKAAVAINAELQEESGHVLS